MNLPLSLNLPPGSQVFNRLYDTQNPELLDEDVLTVRLENGLCIDVGWFPQSDPQGSYAVRVFREHGDADMIDPIRRRDAREVAQWVERLCARFSGQSVNVSEANSTIATARA